MIITFSSNPIDRSNAIFAAKFWILWKQNIPQNNVGGNVYANNGINHGFVMYVYIIGILNHT